MWFLVSPFTPLFLFLFNIYYSFARISGASVKVLVELLGDEDKNILENGITLTELM